MLDIEGPLQVVTGALMRAQGTAVYNSHRLKLDCYATFLHGLNLFQSSWFIQFIIHL